MTTRLTEAGLAEIEARAKAATPPSESLKLMRYDHGGGRLYFERGVGLDTERHLVADFYDEANREFYVAARIDVPALVHDLRAARAALRGILPAASAFALLASASPSYNRAEAEAALEAARDALPAEGG